MTSHYHAVIWLDHHTARVLHFNAVDWAAETIHPAHPVRHIHHHAGSTSGSRVPTEAAFYEAVAAAVGDAGAFLVTGPADAKIEFIKHLHRQHPNLIERLAGVETANHPTDGELIDHARRVFGVYDRTQPQLSR
jgi:hypothetical protein